jgi:hypothetical protein
MTGDAVMLYTTHKNGDLGMVYGIGFTTLMGPG